MNYDVERIITESPSTMILALTGSDRSTLIEKLLDYIQIRDTKSRVFSFDAFGDVLYDFQDHPCVKNYEIGHEKIETYYERMLSEIENRLKFAANNGYKEFPGTRDYFFTDNFSLLNTAKYRITFGKLIYIISSARQSNLYYVSFNKPEFTKYDDGSYFATIAMLRFREISKFTRLIPTKYKTDLNAGKIYIDGFEQGLYEI